MAIIDPSGLFSGRRLRRCGDLARLLWPYLYCAANGFGRLELDYQVIAARIFVGFQNPISEQKFWSVIAEFQHAGLLFVYKAPNGTEWGQWVTEGRYLPRYKTHADHESPTPPPSEYKLWLDQVENDNPDDPKGLQKVSENFRLTRVPIPIPTPSPSPKEGGVGGEAEPGTALCAPTAWDQDAAFERLKQRYAQLKDVELHSYATEGEFASAVCQAQDPAGEFADVMAGLERMAESGNPSQYLPKLADFLRNRRYRERWEPRVENGRADPFAEANRMYLARKRARSARCEVKRG